MKIISYDARYKEKTADFVIKILEEAFRSYNEEWDYDLSKISDIYQSDGGNFWLALDENNEIIGTTALRNYGDGRGYLKRMFVDKNHRGKGVAQKLLSKLISFAKEKQYKTVYLGTYDKLFPAAIKFYAKQGFEKIDTLPSDMPTFGDNVFFKMNL